jgi:hypothetical protein
MSISNEKKAQQLGMPYGTANGRLKKDIMFSLLKELNRNICYRCGELIENSSTLSIEHKDNWLDSKEPAKLFFDINNITYSHLSCNCSQSRGVFKKKYNTDEELKLARREQNSRSERKNYSTSKRKERYIRTGK